MTTAKTVSVSAYLHVVNETLRLISSQEFLIEGELSDFRIAQEKWVSFDLKDEKEEAVLKCFMTTWQLHTPLENGMRVHVRGVPKVYERYGQLKMNVQEVTPVGEGALQRAYELLKQKLETEGLFNVSRKRVLPRFPEHIGLITSRDAAAYGDFLRILENRWGAVRVSHAHVAVQGREAVTNITQAFFYFNALSATEKPDVLVLTRGGGGLEDLHAFNDEHVARAVFSSSIPVVCGVGHERDESLCDFVADVRASTPSNAAERVVPNRQEILYEMETMSRHMEGQLEEVLQQYEFSVHRAVQGIGMIVRRQQEQFRYMYQRFTERTMQWIPQIVERVQASIRVLQHVDPSRVLSRGYSIVRVHNRIISSSDTLELGESVSVQLATGSFEAEVKRIGDTGQQQLI